MAVPDKMTPTQAPRPPRQNQQMSTTLRTNRRAVLAALCLACTGVALAHQQGATIVRYPQWSDKEEFGATLIKVALAKSGGNYIVEPVRKGMQQGRIIAEIASASGVADVMATMTSIEREQRLLPIRIPIDKGLLGWRIALVKADQKALMASVRNLADLARLRAGQGHDWPDVDILRANGLSVRGVVELEGLFHMLALGRIDYCPRAIVELKRDADAHPELAVDSHLLLHYPTAMYFFVNKRNTHLADDIERGLAAAIADGSFEQIFTHFFGESMRQARLDGRRIIELHNPTLPPATPLERKELWFKPDTRSLP